MSAAPVFKMPSTSTIDLKSVFNSHEYSFDQPYVQITEEGYTIKCATGSEVFSAVRPRLIGRNMLAGVGALAAAFVAVLVGVFAVGFIATTFKKFMTPTISGLLGLVFLVTIAGAYLWAKKMLSPKREMSLYDKNKNVVFKIIPASGMFILKHEYRLVDANNCERAVYKKDVLESLFRTYWHCYDHEGKYLFSAEEDSLVKSLLRRYFNLASLIPMHFNFSRMNGKQLGSFKRRFSLRDKYNLNFDGNTVSAWMVISFSLLLDTGEER